MRVGGKTMAVAHIGQDRLSPDELMDALEEIRSDYTGGNSAAARRRPPDTPEKLAAEKRRIHRGGDGNHRFEGERYLYILDDIAVMRVHLRKVTDEVG